MIVRIPVLAIAAAALLASPSSADWRSEAIPGSSGADDPRLLVTPNGAVGVAWRTFISPEARLLGTRRIAPETWSPSCQVARHDLLLGPVARGRSRWLAGVLDTRGRHRVGVVVERPGRCGRRLHWIAGAPRIASPVLAGNRRGDAVLAWFEDRGSATDRVMVALRRPGGGFGPPRRLATGRLRAVAAGLGPRGDVVVVWEADGSVGVRYLAAGRRRFARPQTLRSRPAFGARLTAAVAGTGRAYVGWTAQARSEGGDLGPVFVQASAKPAGQRRFRKAQLLERFDGRVLDGGQLRLGTDRAGGAVAAWTGADGIRAASTAPDGRFLPASTVAAGSAWWLADLVVAPSGAAGILWEPDAESTGPVRYALREPDGRVTPPETVSAQGHGARLAQAAAGPVAVWIEGDGLRLGGPGP